MRDLDHNILLGDGELIRLGDGQFVTAVDADHGATTRPIAEVWSMLEVAARRYGSVFRGSGQRSVLSSELFRASVEKICGFVGVRHPEYTVLFGRNATDLLNRLARRLRLDASDSVLLSDAEHSSNELPWRRTGARILRLRADDGGLLDEDDLQDVLRRPSTGGKRVLAMTGASNVTGAFQPVAALVRAARAAGVMSVVDASQLVAHRPVVSAGNSDAAPDAVVFAGHKMYAPFGVGCLVIRTELLSDLAPDDIGGGTVADMSETSWDLVQDVERRELAGSPNLLGIYAVALAGQFLRDVVGYEAIMRHEQKLLDTLGAGMCNLPDVIVHAPLDWSARRKCALVTFSVKGVTPQAVADRLAAEAGVSVRAGHLCQFRLTERLLRGLDAVGRDSAAEPTRHDSPEFGVVRASFGLGSSVDDVQRFLAGVARITSQPAAPPPEQRTPFSSPASYWFDRSPK